MEEQNFSNTVLQETIKWDKMFNLLSFDGVIHNHLKYKINIELSLL